LAKRFYHIAYELGVPPRHFIRDLAALGLSVGNQMVIVPEDLERRIREVYADLHRPQPVAEVAQPAAEAYAADAAGGATGRVAEPATATLVVDGPEVEEEVAEAVEEPAAAEALAGAEASDDGGSAPVAEVAEAPPDAGRVEPPSRGRRRPGDAPKALDLVPTIDPRAGRLVKEAPKGGVPGVTQPTGRARPQAGEGTVDINPALPQAPRAPGARRDSHRRSSVPERFRGKQGKETFHMRKTSVRKTRPEPVVQRPTSFAVEPPISVKKFSELSGLKAAEVIKVLWMKHQMMVTTNSMLDQDALEILALELELDVQFTKTATEEDTLLSRVEQVDDPSDLVSRPPVVTILGHVDHGKTTLLDTIRKTDIAAREAGGITQHIGASQVKLPDGRRVTFIDTPGHEAFTEMRRRGAQVTDVVVLVVAADDGVMPQTVEAISHARAAGVPIIVALTKVDKDNANVGRVKGQLAEHDVFLEGYGGDVSAFEVSGVTGKGVPELLEHLALLAEVETERFQANPQRMAEGTVVEAANSPQRGVIATVLVRNGSLDIGDPILAGEAWGTVRAMVDYLGRPVERAMPGDPVEVIGLDQPPEAGARIYEVEDKDRARVIAEQRREKSRERELAAQNKPTTVESLLGAIDEGKVQELNIVLKADVKGSLEPIRRLLDRMTHDEVRVRVIHSAVGAVNDSDVILASASRAWVVGFNVNVDEKARARAKLTGVEIRTYRIVYEIESDVRDALEGKLAPEQREVILGHAEVLKVFSSSKFGNIAGCRVRDGMIRRDSRLRLLRAGEVIAGGRVASLRREKDEVREVKDGFECGIRLEGYDAFQEGDELEAYTIEEVKRTL
jgi:translation initiation factor IF-2